MRAPQEAQFWNVAARGACTAAITLLSAEPQQLTQHLDAVAATLRQLGFAREQAAALAARCPSVLTWAPELLTARVDAVADALVDTADAEGLAAFQALEIMVAAPALLTRPVARLHALLRALVDTRAARNGSAARRLLAGQPALAKVAAAKVYRSAAALQAAGFKGRDALPLLSRARPAVLLARLTFLSELGCEPPDSTISGKSQRQALPGEKGRTCAHVLQGPVRSCSTRGARGVQLRLIPKKRDGARLLAPRPGTDR